MRNRTEYRKAQLKAIGILVELSQSVSFGWMQNGKKQCVQLAVCLSDMERHAGISAPQCMPTIQEEKDE